jgi:uncharacterized membrane protein YphA (DoxX/SURF4 family)
MNKLVLNLPGGLNIKDPEGMTFASGTRLNHLINRSLPFVFYLAGLLLFIMLIIGGFGMLTSGGSPDKMKAAQGKITSAVIGFVIVFISYWLVRILEIVFGIQILE